MIHTNIKEVAREVQGEPQFRSSDAIVHRVSVDSRGVSPNTLFVALEGQRTNGHYFLHDAFENGACGAIVASSMLNTIGVKGDWPLIVVPSPLAALQRLAACHRGLAFAKVLAITGSNGKTIVKNMLTALLAKEAIFASPGSFNSQLGLPLSVLLPERRFDLGVLEVGVSAPGEMGALENVARPDYGILTNIGMAHFAAFGSRAGIAREKMELFRRIGDQGWILVPSNEPAIRDLVKGLRCRVYEVGGPEDVLSLETQSLVEGGLMLELRDGSGASFRLSVKTRSPEIVSDLHFAASAAFLLGVGLESIAEVLEGYSPPPTRMEVWCSRNGIRVINDTHSSDPLSVRAALRSACMWAPQNGRRLFVFGGMHELGERGSREHRQVGAYAGECGYSHLLLFGDRSLQGTAEAYRKARPDGDVIRVESLEELTQRLLGLVKYNDTILFKGPRRAGLGRAVQEISGTMAQRCLRVDLGAVANNLAKFRRHCGGGVEILAMFKALAYGTDLAQFSFWMGSLGLRHIGVSAASEGVAIRKSGADQSIYVFLSEGDDANDLLRYRLTPIVYSADLAQDLARELSGTSKRLPVHLKVDTGMHRLGVDPRDAVDLAKLIRNTGSLRLTGVCTHFAAADDPRADEYTRDQISVFNETVAALRANGFTDLTIHAANTAATIRFPEARYDMVRLGLGLYGAYPSQAVSQALDLELAIAATSRIATIRKVAPGDTVGYNRSYSAPREMKVGVVPFGYHDGMPWRASQGGKVLVEGHAAPIVGRISMDQMTVDITGIEGLGVGAEVLLYGARAGHVLRPEWVAESGNTITHELLARLGPRVRRIFVEP